MLAAQIECGIFTQNPQPKQFIPNSVPTIDAEVTCGQRAEPSLTYNRPLSFCVYITLVREQAQNSSEDRLNVGNTTTL